MAVILSFEEYRRLQDLAKREQAETRAKWRERFERLLAEVHRRTSQFSSEEIEAEITAAYDEVRELRYGHRGWFNYEPKQVYTFVLRNNFLCPIHIECRIKRNCCRVAWG